MFDKTFDGWTITFWSVQILLLFNNRKNNYLFITSTIRLSLTCIMIDNSRCCSTLNHKDASRYYIKQYVVFDENFDLILDRWKTFCCPKIENLRNIFCVSHYLTRKQYYFIILHFSCPIRVHSTLFHALSLSFQSVTLPNKTGIQWALGSKIILSSKKIIFSEK